jgi:hypothetical protein
MAIQFLLEKLIHMLGTTWVYEPIVLTANFMKSE